MLQVLGIIPAREGSKRVPFKNFRPFATTTLVDLSIQHAISSSLITDIVVSSDSIKVLAIAAAYQKVTGLKRPEAFASDESPAIHYVQHAVKEMEKLRNFSYDVIVILQPSSPLRTSA